MGSHPLPSPVLSPLVTDSAAVGWRCNFGVGTFFVGVPISTASCATALCRFVYLHSSARSLDCNFISLADQAHHIRLTHSACLLPTNMPDMCVLPTTLLRHRLLTRMRQFGRYPGHWRRPDWPWCCQKTQSNSMALQVLPEFWSTHTVRRMALHG